MARTCTQLETLELTMDHVFRIWMRPSLTPESLTPESVQCMSSTLVNALTSLTECHTDISVQGALVTNNRNTLQHVRLYDGYVGSDDFILGKDRLFTYYVDILLSVWRDIGTCCNLRTLYCESHDAQTSGTLPFEAASPSSPRPCPHPHPQIGVSPTHSRFSHRATCLPS